MSKGESNSGCVSVVLVFVFFGAIVWLFGAALWLLQFILPVVGLAVAIWLGYTAWRGLHNGRKAEKLAELNRTELVNIARDTEFRLSAIISSWDNVAHTMGVGTVFKEAFSSGEATPELVALRGDLMHARNISEKLRVGPDMLSDEELIGAISEADQLWLSLTSRYGDAAN